MSEVTEQQPTAEEQAAMERIMRSIIRRMQRMSARQRFADIAAVSSRQKRRRKLARR